MVSEAYIVTAEQVIQDSLYDVLYNMSFLLKDSEGKVPDREARFVSRHLTVNPLGVVTNIGDLSITSPYDIHLGMEVLDPKLSEKAIQLLPRVTALDAGLIVKGGYEVDSQISSMLYYSTSLSPEIRTCMAYLYLELYCMYTSIVDYRAGGIFSTSTQEVDTVMSNTRFIRDKIGQFGNQEEVYDLLNVLIHIQRAISVSYTHLTLPTILLV